MFKNFVNLHLTWMLKLIQLITLNEGTYVTFKFLEEIYLKHFFPENIKAKYLIYFFSETLLRISAFSLNNII